MKKKLISLLLALCLLASLIVACSNDDDDLLLDSSSEQSSTIESSSAYDESNDESSSEKIEDEGSENESSSEDSKEDDDEPNEPPVFDQPWAEDGELKILAIGNSFSDDAMEHVYQVAKDAGVEKIKLGNMFIGGCSLEKHLENAKGNKGAYDFRTNTNGTWSTKGGTSIQTAVTSENWDFITFQQVSGYSGVADSYDDLVELISIIKPLSGDAQLAWHMTWAYKVGSSHSDFSKYSHNQMTMYNAIVNAVNTKILTNNDIAIVIPSGTSIQNVRTSFIGDMTRDGYHLSYGIGRYIASMTYVKALTGLSIDNSKTVPSDVDSQELKAIIEGVNNAIAKPYEVTNSSYPKVEAGSGSNDSANAGVIPSGFVQLTATQMGLTSSSFYNSSSNGNLNTGSNNWYGGFMATKKFTRDELPVGSIIEIASGWQYRPEGWNYTGTRPENVTTLRIVIDEAWWGSYTERAFNISQIGHSTSHNIVIAQSSTEIANTVFKIIVPNTAVN